MINPRGTIEVNGKLADFDCSRPGWDFADRWRSDDKLLEAEIRRIARGIGCPHSRLDYGAAMHIIKVARKLGGRVVSMVDCPSNIDTSDPWFDW
jgi:hypothetical protein